jgi:lipopolysaccharide transport system permease protein
VRIRPSRGWAALNLAEVWAYRELLYFLTWRDVKVRYKQTALGAAWAVLQPLLTMVAFSIFFGGLAWGFFANALGAASNSLVGSANLISKVYFPRLVIPVSSVLSGAVDFGIAFVVLLGMMAYYGVAPTPAIVLLPVFLLLALASGLAVGLWLSALNVQYRDIRYVIPFLSQLWLLATPVAYPSSLLSEPWRTVYGLNPMVGVVEGFRWALLGASAPGPLTVASAAVTLALLVGGALYFRRMEKTYADLV